MESGRGLAGAELRARIAGAARRRACRDNLKTQRDVVRIAGARVRIEPVGWVSGLVSDLVSDLALDFTSGFFGSAAADGGAPEYELISG